MIQIYIVNTDAHLSTLSVTRRKKAGQKKTMFIDLNLIVNFICIRYRRRLR